MPGVVAVWTAEDIADIPPIDFREGPIEKLAPYRQPVLAVHKVRYVGEPIAVVFAEDPYIAEDAADIVTMEVEELPPLLDARDEPGEFSFARDTEATVLNQGYGDVEAVFKTAPHIVGLKLTSGRHSGVPLETRGAIGRYDASRDVLELHGAAKVPHRNKELIARMLNRPPSSVQCFESHVGGGFGIRGEIYPEDILVCVAAMRFERPVKWIEDRREHLIAANHSRNQHHHIKAAVADDGEILAIDDEIFHDNGAYVRTHATRVAMMTCGVLPGPYRVPGAYRATCHFRLTNKTPAATYRAPGRFETTFVRERLVDAIAHQLRLDPIHVRRRNAVTVNEMPFKRPLEALGEEIHFDSGDYHALLDTTLKHVEWAKLNEELAARREEGEMVGVGLAMFVEKAGLGPADGVRIQVDTSGAVEVITGGASIGQGFETVMAQVAAEFLGTDYQKMRVIHGQTDRIEQGIGAHASRATVMTASATQVAALKVRDKALNMAADLLQSPADSLDIVNGEVVIAGRKGGPSISLGKVAAALGPSSKLRGDREPGLSAEGWFYADHQVYPYGNHLAVVKVDPDTGFVKVLRYVVAYDVGRALNPALVKGQIAGGFAQGLGGALMEEFTYNERGDPLSSTFGDYLLPTIKDVPDIEIILTEDYPSPLNPLGIKGAGESGVNGVGAAIAAAIDDAIGMPGAITELPVTPQRLKAIIDGKR
jgi:carbon-monoxide dehydrogenase large subunit